MDARRGEPVRRATGYRVPAVPSEALWRVALDPACDPEVRSGAVLALRPRLDDAGRARLRDVAKACAAPRLRVAISAAAEEDDTALFDALTDQPACAAS